MSDAAPTTAPGRKVLLHRAAVGAMLAGLLVTGVFSWVAYTAKDRNNLRLLGLQTEESAAVLGTVVTTIQTPLASAAEIAETTHGDPAAFRRYIEPAVGAQGHVFVSASLWNTAGKKPVLVTTVGAAPLLAPSKAQAFFSRTELHNTLGVGSVFEKSSARLTYAYAPQAAAHDFVVESESVLPKGRYAPITRRSAFSDLNFALYLGKSPVPSALLEASVHRLPIPGPTTSALIPFGDSQLIFVASANGELGGALAEDIWWLLALVGVAMTLGVAVMTERILRSRLAAQAVAVEVGRLYAEQRTVAETLQHALLPQELPDIPGLELAVRYAPGVEGLEIGGDWYDVLRVDDHRLLFVVGDVSGRGLQAASFMAALRFAIRAYALEGHPPEVIFKKLGDVLNIARDKHFATVLCALIDTTTREITVVNAGHPNAVLRDANGANFLPSAIGPPIGVGAETDYTPMTSTIAPGSIVLGFTDGLIERRGESIDVGLARVQNLVAASDPDRPIGDLLNELVDKLTPDGPSDDIALLGLKWN